MTSPLRPWILLLAFASPAFADEIIPSVADPAAVEGVPQTGALVYQAVASISHEHSCSQSFESSSYRANFTLSVDANGAARLTLDADDAYTFGPSPGRYRSGDHQFDHRNQPSKSAWHGTATRSGGGLALHLVADGGDSPILIKCRVAPIDVGEWWQDKSLPTRTKALLCDGGETLVGKHHDLSVGSDLAFGRNAGFQVSVGRMDMPGRGERGPRFSRAL